MLLQNSLFCFLAKLVQGFFQSLLPLIPGKEHREGCRLEFLSGVVPDSCQFLVGQQRMLQFEHSAMLRSGLEEVMHSAQPAGKGHHEFFPDGIDGRIAHLGEDLFEIIKKQSRLGGKHSQRGIISHRPGGLSGGFDHGQHQDHQVFHRVAENLLPL